MINGNLNYMAGNRYSVSKSQNGEITVQVKRYIADYSRYKADI